MANTALIIETFWVGFAFIVKVRTIVVRTEPRCAYMEMSPNLASSRRFDPTHGGLMTLSCSRSFPICWIWGLSPTFFSKKFAIETDRDANCSCYAALLMIQVPVAPEIHLREDHRVFLSQYNALRLKDTNIQRFMAKIHI